MDDCITFGLGFKSNRETNEFLRCLWSRMEIVFGKLSWMYSPFRVNNTIFVGQANIGENKLLDVRIHYKQRGCLSSIEFRPLYNLDISKVKSQLKQCVFEAQRYEEYREERYGAGNLDKNISFRKRTEKNYEIGGNSVVLKVCGYDDKDCATLFKSQLQQVCNLLSFDTLKYISMGGTLTEEIRENHNFRTRLMNSETGKVTGEMEKNEMYRNLVLSDRIAAYIDTYLERPYGYEGHYTNFDKSVQLFAQALRNEEFSGIATGLPEPYAELAIVNYMSALEVITLNDKEPVSCRCCGQMKYSIARRVTDLAEKTFNGFDGFVKDYYGDRSKYVHTGALLSSNSYVGKSIPLMSTCKNSKTGMITQVGRVLPELKEMVKACIEWHEVNFSEYNT